jgi:hypothetical protein
LVSRNTDDPLCQTSRRMGYQGQAQAHSQETVPRRHGGRQVAPAEGGAPPSGQKPLRIGLAETPDLHRN